MLIMSPSASSRNQPLTIGLGHCAYTAEVINFWHESKSSEGLDSASVSVGLGWHPRISISTKFPGDTDAAGPGTSL